MITLERLNNEKPILIPRPGIEWESKGICNPGAIKINGTTYLLYRAYDSSNHSSFGLATSSDGIHFERTHTEPVFRKQVGAEYEKDGIENPRITRIDNTYHILYTSAARYDFPGQTPDHIWKTAVCRATTEDFLKYNRQETVLNTGFDKDAALFPEKIDGYYYMYHRAEELNIGLSRSRDFKTWELLTESFLVKTDNDWENERVSHGPPPIKTSKGWLSFYHGRNREHIYSISAVLSALHDPAKIIARLPFPLLQPQKDYEKEGSYPNTVYTNGAVEVGEDIFIYYGCADYAIGVAKVNQESLINNLIQ